MCLDAVSPLGGMFYTLCLLLLGVISQALRTIVSTRSVSAWFFWSMSCHLAIGCIAHGGIPIDLGIVMAEAVVTAVITLLLAALSAPIPRGWRPITDC